MTQPAPITPEVCLDWYYSTFEHYSLIDFQIQPCPDVDMVLIAVNKKYGFMIYIVKHTSTTGIQYFSKTALAHIPATFKPHFLALMTRSHIVVEQIENTKTVPDELINCIPAVHTDFKIWFEGQRYVKAKKRNLQLYAILTQDAGEGYKIFSCFWSKHTNLTDEHDARLPYKLDTITSKILIKKL